MPVMTDRRALTANQRVTTVLSGKLHEYADRNYLCRVFATASTVGANMVASIGTRVFVDDQEVNAQNRMPLVPDDFVAEVIARRGEKIVIGWREAAGGTPTVFTRIELLPI